MLSLPSTLTKKEIQLIHTQWPFFNIAYSYVVLNLPYSFPSCNIIKTAVQALYNSMKVGLDANLQQSLAILPPIKTGLCHMIYHHNSHKLMEGLATVGTTYWSWNFILHVHVQETLGKKLLIIERPTTTWQWQFHWPLLPKCISGTYKLDTTQRKRASDNAYSWCNRHGVKSRHFGGMITRCIVAMKT